MAILCWALAVTYLHQGFIRFIQLFPILEPVTLTLTKHLVHWFVVEADLRSGTGRPCFLCVLDVLASENKAIVNQVVVT